MSGARQDCRLGVEAVVSSVAGSGNRDTDLILQAWNLFGVLINAIYFGKRLLSHLDVILVTVLATS